MPSMVDRVALYGVPIVAGIITAGVLIGPARERPALGARLYGGVVEGATRCALRVHGRQQMRGSYADYASPITVAIERSGERRVEVVATSPKGAAPITDVVLELDPPVRGPLDISVMEGKRVLVAARAEPTPALAVRPVPRVSLVRGDAELRVGLVRGFAVPELPEPLAIALDYAAGQNPPSLIATAAGADLGPLPKATVSCDSARCRAAWRLELTARAPTAEVDVVIRRDGVELVRWAGPLDVVAGRIWLAPDPTSALRLRSAVPRDVAYVSVVSALGRLWGARVPMEPDDRGGASGVIEVPVLGGQPVVVRVAGEPDEPPDGTATWPVDGATVIGGELALLGDGLPDAIVVERTRQREARRPAYALIVCAGVFELVFLFWRSRRSRLRLERHLAREGEAGAAAAGTASLVQSALPLTLLLVLAGALALAFGVLALLTALG